MSNLNRAATYIPVSDFQKQNLPIQDEIAGLLDYGYSTEQVAKMVNIPLSGVKDIINQYGYKEAELHER
jgi:hypothetical protein